MNHVIRTVRPDEWPRTRELRLDALRDPAAPVAFLETYEQAVEHPDAVWQERAAGFSARHGTRSVQFVAEAADGGWSGSVAVLVEEAGREDFFGGTVERAQGHLVGVFVRPEHRGGRVVGELVGAALDWAWALEDPRLARVRLYVNEGNPRAAAAYRKLGFAATGGSVPMAGDPSAKELELAVERP
ncbi:GNAT family N-acetyltransferase [Streptomyces sp. NPDC050509]|uniref:GNAT family N-acetyltransferase n=1 Tax=Streptomyces sp. NPDC050509 TaxID=3365620 RepID=UPI0037B1BEFD